MKANRTTRMYFKSFCGKATIDKHQLHRLALIIAVLSTQMRKCRTIDLRNMSFSRKLFGKLRNPNVTEKMQSTLIVVVMVIKSLVCFSHRNNWNLWWRSNIPFLSMLLII